MWRREREERGVRRKKTIITLKIHSPLIVSYRTALARKDSTKRYVSAGNAIGDEQRAINVHGRENKRGLSEHPSKSYHYRSNGPRIQQETRCAYARVHMPTNSDGDESVVSDVYGVNREDTA